MLALLLWIPGTIAILAAVLVIAAFAEERVLHTRAALVRVEPPRKRP